MRFGIHQPYEVIVCGAGHAGCEAAPNALKGAEELKKILSTPTRRDAVQWVEDGLNI
jgi:tRNA U34 5-carboxymethylaminomethyl modifying enzyme MnmG/GidA